MRRNLTQCAIAAAFFASLSPLAGLPGGAQEVGILATGEVFPQECPLPSWFRDEPGFYLTLIPTKADFVTALTLEEARRFIRLYFPRTSDQLEERYGFLAFIDADLAPFTGLQVESLRHSVEEAGASAFVSLGGGVFTFNYGMWASSSLSGIFPHDFLQTSSGQLAPSFTVEVNRGGSLPPVLKMLIPVGIERVVGKTWGEIYPKDGATTWASIRPAGSGQRHPFMVSMPFGTGGGTTWAIADDLDHPWWSSVYEPSTNEYSQDVFLNLVYHSLGHLLPDDIIAIHAVRMRFTGYGSWRSVALGTLDFLESFGAPTSALFEALASLDEELAAARDEYARQEYGVAAARMDSVIERTLELDRDAIESKDRALFWVYTTEWLAVTGTFLAAGAVLHSLMVGRRLYRSAGETSFGRSN